MREDNFKKEGRVKQIIADNKEPAIEDSTVVVPELFTKW